MSRVPVPSVKQVREVRAALRQHLKDGNYADASACQSWLSVYVERRADGEVIYA